MSHNHHHSVILFNYSLFGNTLDFNSGFQISPVDFEKFIPVNYMEKQMKNRILPNLVFSTLGLFFLSEATAKSLSLEFLGEKIIASGSTFSGTTIGGLSGIDYDREKNSFYAISDDRSRDARFYTLNMDIDRNGINAVNFTNVTNLKDIGNQPFAQSSLDPESIRFNAARDSLFWTSERNQNGDPWVREMKLDGSFVKELNTPSKFKPSTGTGIGVSNNRAFESLTFSLDGSKVFTATEQALVQDDSLANTQKGSKVRILELNTVSGDTGVSPSYRAEYVYEVGPVSKGDDQGFEDNGLVELLALNNGNLLSVEREFVAGVGNTIKVFEVDLTGAEDVSGKQALDGTEQAATKELLLDFDELDLLLGRDNEFSYLNSALDNIEGVTFGPEIDGFETLIFVSDDNFNAFDDGIDGNGDDQFTQFLAFKITPVPVPPALPLFLSAVAGLFVTRAKKLNNQG